MISHLLDFFVQNVTGVYKYSISIVRRADVVC